MAINIFENFNLRTYNSFGLDLFCKKFIEYTEKKDIINFINYNSEIFKEKYFVLGNGTNVLFSEKYFDGIIIHQKEKRIKNINEKDYERIGDNYFFTVAASLNLDSFIDATSSLSYAIVNLSGIPGTVGAGIVQNCGAYGSEISDFFHSLQAIDIKTGKIFELKKNDCEFDYRNSIFKHKYANSLIILEINFLFPNLKNYIPKFNNRELYNNFKNNNEYFNIINNLGKLKSEQEDILLKTKLLKMVRNFIIETRNKKIPDYKIFGNAGSFFKNPIINKEKLDKILDKYPETNFFENGNNDYKLPAGWLIDKCDLKGFKHKGAAVSDMNALVLINKNNSNGKEIIELSEIVKEKVFQKFDILLEPEVIFL